MSLPLMIILVYIILLFAISFWAKKRSSGCAENYSLAGRQLSTPLIAVSIIGLAVGGASTIGVSEHAFRVGLSAGWYTIAWGIGAITMGMLLAKKYRQQNITTISELIEKHHDKKAVVLGVICQIVIQMVIISLQYIAGGSILHALLPDIFDLKTGMIVSAIVFIGITFIGGMWSASLSNILNILLIYGGITVATFTQTNNLGGLQNISLALPQNVPWFDPIAGVGIKGIFSWIVVMVTVNLSLQSIIQISLGAKDEATSKRGFVLGGLLMIPIGFMAALLGVCAKAVHPELTPAVALPQVIMELEPLLAGITLAALWAADVSTACNLLLSAATLFAKDIYKGFLKPNTDDFTLQKVMRYAVLAVGIFTFGIALSVSGIIPTIMAGLSLTAAFSVIVLVALFAPEKTSVNAGFYTLLIGLIVLIIWQTIPSVRLLPHVIYAEWLFCSLTYALVARLDAVNSVKTASLLASTDSPE